MSYMICRMGDSQQSSVSTELRRSNSYLSSWLRPELQPLRCQTQSSPPDQVTSWRHMALQHLLPFKKLYVIASRWTGRLPSSVIWGLEKNSEIHKPFHAWMVHHSYVHTMRVKQITIAGSRRREWGMLLRPYKVLGYIWKVHTRPNERQCHHLPLVIYIVHLSEIERPDGTCLP